MSLGRKTIKNDLSTCLYAIAAMFILDYAILIVMDNLLMGYSEGCSILIPKSPLS